MTGPAPRFLTVAEVLAIHRVQAGLWGGAAGVLHQASLEAAVAAPRMLAAYEPASDVWELAAAYAFHLTQDHPFVDGNKRTAFLAVIVFVSLNQGSFPSQAELVLRQTIMDIAAGKCSREQAGSRLRAKLTEAG